jgi:hypothetical protein
VGEDEAYSVGSVGVSGFLGSGSMFHRRRRRDTKLGHGESASRGLAMHNLFPGSVGWDRMEESTITICRF